MRHMGRMGQTLVLVGAVMLGVLLAPANCSARAADAVIQKPPAGLIASALGVTRRGTAIECWLNSEDFDLSTKKTRITVIGGLDGDPRSVAWVSEALHWFYSAEGAGKWRE